MNRESYDYEHEQYQELETEDLPRRENGSRDLRLLFERPLTPTRFPRLRLAYLIMREAFLHPRY